MLDAFSVGRLTVYLVLHSSVPFLSEQLKANFPPAARGQSETSYQAVH
jgi:hypothetical protein